MDYVQGMENIVTGDRASFLVQVCGEDSEWVIGYFVDIRGLRVSTDEARFHKVRGKPTGPREIALRIKIGQDEHPLPGPGQLAFDHSTRDYVGV